ncbi:hypothetical protein AVEN_71626-1 [Araneus ventricosus]|uniref:Uncharacterized protein n=1 Tax=Araneus ventricosus TaxID=182803 RepID=A0A4Y2GG40_ARAVE|nr:hypothetical protein AVEN_71626-1 [Araneus ventricosus]
MLLVRTQEKKTTFTSTSISLVKVFRSFPIRAGRLIYEGGDISCILLLLCHIPLPSNETIKVAAAFHFVRNYGHKMCAADTCLLVYYASHSNTMYADRNMALRWVGGLIPVLVFGLYEAECEKQKKSFPWMSHFSAQNVGKPDRNEAESR